MDFEALLQAYDYEFPPELLAKEPVSPRDSARLLVYDRKKDSVVFDTFSSITDYLPKNALLVMNRTKVIPAKMTLTKRTGGKVSALVISRDEKNITTLASGSFSAGDILEWQSGHSFQVISRIDQEAVLQPCFDIVELDALLDTFGETPLPPYMKDSPLTEEKRRTEYQTVFALEKGSVAAPTAGLHFTEGLITKIIQSGRSISYLSLHVGLGTFAPLTKLQVEKGALHHESYSIDAETADLLNTAKAEGRPIIAVGTTSVRTLESAAMNGRLSKLQGSTDLFITENSQLHFVDHLITNFHVPRSSLLMLVSAFTGREKLLSIYDQAIKEQMRLFSFGDGMLIL
ncbi:MAG: tRNA preQ1(34) S-adenosylmethionine ribosyltransferase-isomerase QueA [Candidatus Peribacteraceae bacterium]|nr:tRNA preQ1(34) S-adenosylmethionine ribosyltransferase-isomerase QueA [Candidatus Peribacteraceae bacterium]MBP9850097.1 tRNA preQ1(34) S-adenosylmethionine ribosyltransferase-isomerase QueA [Candidatus Peribacteraceae bacterium]